MKEKHSLRYNGRAGHDGWIGVCSCGVVLLGQTKQKVRDRHTKHKKGQA